MSPLIYTVIVDAATTQKGRVERKLMMEESELDLHLATDHRSVTQTKIDISWYV